MYTTLSGNRNPIYARTVTQVPMHVTQLCKLIAQQNPGVSATVLREALRLIVDGILLAVARGYSVQIRSLCTFELREVPARKRYHRRDRTVYQAPPTCRVHIRSADQLNFIVRKRAEEELANAVRTVPLAFARKG